MTAAPVADSDRIESLDVLRGFALLGILLLNILGFGLVSAAYSNPAIALTGSADLAAWAAVELFAEGAMRCLFSILFGAGVVLFTSGRSAALHFKRNFWLLAFGLFDAYVLLWSGDILINYALAGALLYWVRDAQPARLMIAAGVLVLLMSAMYSATQFGMGVARQAAQQVEQSDAPASLPAEVRAGAEQWYGFSGDFQPTAEQQAEELKLRRDSYRSAFSWNVQQTNGMLLFVLPVVLFWDALAMMLLGMALYKYGVLQGQRSRRFYTALMLGGFALGLTVNALEVNRAMSNDFVLLSVFAQAQASYHFGRLGMAMGYMGLLMLIIDGGGLRTLRRRLAAVGRMALTNYLMHSLICLFVFTGAGVALVGQLPRWQLYIVVLAIWVVQLALSPWWLARYRFGPVEWLWRGLTYGQWPANRRRARLESSLP